MTTTITEYDPNNRWGKHTVELHLMMWANELRVTVTVDGNCRGFTILEAAIDSYADKLYDEQGDNPEITLVGKDDEGDVHLLCSPDGEPIENWLRAMVVGVRIVSFEPEAIAA